MNLPTRNSSAIKSLKTRGLTLAAAMVAIGALASGPAFAQARWDGTPDHGGYTDHHWGYGGYYNGYVGSYGAYNDTPAWSYSYPADTYYNDGPSYNGYYPYGYTTYYPYSYGYYPYGYAPAPGIGVRVGPVGVGVFP
jgi:hypothetical protein